MAATTSGEDDEAPRRDQEREDISSPDQADDAGRQTASRYNANAEVISYLDTARDLRNVLAHDATWTRVRDLVAGVTTPQAKHRVGRDQIVNVNVGAHVDVETQTNATPQPAPPRPGLAERRLEFHFDVLKLKLKHAQWMLFFSVFAVAAGLVAMLVGVVVALVHTNSPHGYVTGASGLVASLGGSALHRHAKRAMSDLTEAAKRNEDKIDVDHQIEVATTLIDRVGDKDLKDRLNSTAALKALNVHPDPDKMFNSLLPGDQPKEIEPGDTAE